MSSAAAGPPELSPVTRSLRSLAAPGGGISTLALDHRDAMVNAYRRVGIEDVDEATMIATKVRIVEALTPRSSSILLDSVALGRCRRPGLPVLMPLEQQGHEDFEGGRLNLLLEDFSAADAARLEVQACKLLLYYRADHEPSARRQMELVEAVAADCHLHGLPLVVEPKTYLLAGESEEQLAAVRGDLVVAGVGDLSGSGADLLKVEFPGDLRTCERVTAAAAPLGWTLFGGSDVDGDTFVDQLRVACEGGAGGFIAGRAIWGGVVAEPEDRQSSWLERHAVPIFERLVDITDRYARRLS